MTGVRKANKPSHQASSPFRSPDISQLGQPHCDVVTELLINLLSPLGQYRQTQSKAARKKSKKRKRKPSLITTSLGQDQEKQHSVEPTQGVPAESEEVSSGATKSAPPQPPTIKHFCLIGFNSVTRHLEDLSCISSRQTMSERDPPPHPSAVFLFRALDDLIYSHLPLLCHTASLAHPDLPPTRLVLLNPAAEQKITEAVAQVRGASVLALLDDQENEAGTRALVDYVHENVEPVDVPWLKQVKDGQWLGTSIEVK